MRKLMVLGVLVSFCAATATVSAQMLVYDQDPFNHYAATAVLGADPGSTIAGAGNFNALLAGGAWDKVVVDAPNAVPVGGWGPLISYIEGGGAVCMSYWNWGREPALMTAFGATGTVGGDMSLVDATLVNTRPYFWHLDFTGRQRAPRVFRPEAPSPKSAPAITVALKKK